MCLKELLDVLKTISFRLNSSNVARTLSYDVENDMFWYFDVTEITKLRDEYGLDGTGVKVGTIEGYVPDTSVPCFANSDITNRPSNVGNWLSAPNGHMNYTTSIMAALTSEYTGGIPNAKFYAASTKNNLVSGIHTSGKVENNPITAFNITVKKRGNNDY